METGKSHVDIKVGLISSFTQEAAVLVQAATLIAQSQERLSLLVGEAMTSQYATVGDLTLAIDVVVGVRDALAGQVVVA